MYKRLFFILLMVLFCVRLAAQPPGVSGFRLYERDYKIAIGPKAGVGLSTGTAVQLYDFKASYGLSYQAGLAVNAHFGKRSRFGFGNGGTGWFGAEAEILYEMRNLKLNGTAVRMNCIEIPLLAQVYPIEELGIEVGVTMVKVLGFTPDVMQSDYAFLHTGQIKGGDVMLTTGLCFKAAGMMIDARYNLGMSSLAGNFDTKVSTVTLSLAYLINVVK